MRLSWQLHQAERRAEERRLRLAARGMADPAEVTVAAESDGEVDGAGAVAGEIEIVDVEHVEVPAPGSTPRREPRPVRESLVIPVLVASPDPDVMQSATIGDADPDAAVQAMDGSSTVDLTMDPADLAEIRAARRGDRRRHVVGSA